MIRILSLCLKYNLSSHVANLPNLVAGTLGMIANNILFAAGMWGMLFAGKPENNSLMFYSACTYCLLLIAWGGINFFFGGWVELGELIVNGQFESKLSTPRHPLLLVSVHALHPSALGDFLMGLLGALFIIAFGPSGVGLRICLGSFVAFLALFSVYIFSGSLAFFVPRGNALAMLVREITLSVSLYPMGRVYESGVGRFVLLMTPAAAVSILPMEWVESANIVDFFAALGAAGIFLVIALAFYSAGVRRYQALSHIGAQN